eukprot:505025-Alexandrium_andersonii.AAC.1
MQCVAADDLEGEPQAFVEQWAPVPNTLFLFFLQKVRRTGRSESPSSSMSPISGRVADGSSLSFSCSPKASQSRMMMRPLYPWGRLSYMRCGSSSSRAAF